MKSILLGIIAIIFLALMLVFQFYGLIWLRAWASGARVTFMELIALALRRIPVRKIVDTRITLIKSGFNVSVDDLSTHYHAEGDVEMVAAGMIKAKEKNIDLSFDQACALDLQDKGIQKKKH